MTICSKCIVPDNYPNVKINDGECTFCNLNEEIFGNKSKTNNDEKLKLILEDERHSKYNCVVPISGGKDSSYILYYLVKKLELNPLAVFFDSGFATEDAKHNVKTICKKLNVDLIVKHASPYRKKMAETIWKVSYYTGRFFSFCGNCENNNRTAAINEAIHQKIKYIIWGSTDFEDDALSLLAPSASRFRDSFASLKHFWELLMTKLFIVDQILLKDKIPFSSKIKALFHYSLLLHYHVMDNIKMRVPSGLQKLNPFLQVSFNNKKTKTLYFYDYIPYDPFYQIRVLEKEVSWKSPNGREAKMDCLLTTISNLSHFKKTGLTYTGFKLAVLARNSMITREEALNKEKNEVDFLKSYFQSEELHIQPALMKIKEIILN